MNKLNFLSGLIDSLFNKKNKSKSFSFLFEKKPSKTINDYVDNVYQAKGEISALNFSEELLEFLEKSDDKTIISFFDYLENDYDLDINLLNNTLLKYEKKNEFDHYKEIKNITETKRLEIFRRLNSTQHGTIKLVKLREKLLNLLVRNEKFRKIDFDLSNLFKDWFNRGFLILKPIDWETPANILEKIIQYEAVHQIRSWEELRSRLEPDDRKCFAYFHPAMEDEPLIFIEVALTKEIPKNINDILHTNRLKLESQEASTAVFYSISNCQKGLQGISFGNFLIKQVAKELENSFSKLKTFITLSPVPGFMKWLETNNHKLYKKMKKNLNVSNIEKNKDLIQKSVLEYFFISHRKDDLPNDPVARFHLGNGATLQDINFFGDMSEKALNQSLGFMVNYLYDLEEVEKYHEKYVIDKKINASKKLLKEFQTS